MYYKSGQKRGEQDFWLPVHQHERIGYKHWLGYVINDGEKKRPSEIITDIPNKINTSEFRIWAFGYDMDNMKARCWYEGIIPVILIEMQFREIYNHYAANIIKTADKVANDIAWHIKAAIYNVEIETNKNKDFNFVKTRFWQETESGFYNAIKDLRDFITKNNSQIPEEILNNWLKFLAKKAEEIFDDITQSGEFNAVDPGRVAKAWNELYWKIFSDETKSILGLPFEPKQASDKKSKKSKDA
ncbi:MAG: type I-E CRISPR-associated protein Cse1/CasA [Elusimicrobiota bacterium]